MCERNPKISIVIPVYNGSNYLAEAIDSALAQTYPDKEILVVNDGSTDNGATAAIAASYGDKIRYFEKENGGSSSALNWGIQNMKGEWFSWLSHDDLYYPNKLQHQVDYIASLDTSAEELPNHIFFGASDLIDEKGQYLRKSDYSKAQATHEKLASLVGNQYLIADFKAFHGCTCLIHKKAFDKVGMFDENLRLLNDVDLWFRLYTADFKVHYIPQPLVMGRMHAKQVSRSIGFSYHNPEQDMFWARSLDWLEEHHPNEYDLFFAFGKNAYLKTRNREGDRAFALAGKLCPAKKPQLVCRKCMYKVYGAGRSAAKWFYMRLKL